MRLSITSLISTAPAAHSPPKPSPWRLRVSSNCSYDCVKPERNVKNANQTIVSRRTATRPYRSARMPAIHPPADQRRHHDGVELHVHRVERPAGKARPECPPLADIHAGEPIRHEALRGRYWNTRHGLFQRLKGVNTPC